MPHRIEVTFVPSSAGELPFSYREAVQGLFYRLLPKATSRWLHDEGIATEHGRWKPIVFSRLVGKLTPNTATKTFQVTGPLTLKIASPKEDLVDQLAIGFARNRRLRLGKLELEVGALALATIEPPPPSASLVARSPVTVFVKRDGRRRYFGAQEPEFAERLLANLRTKARALGLEEAASAEARVVPLDPVPHNKKVERFRKLIIEGWMGRYRIEGPAELAWVALTSGLGALGSQGFGFVEVVGDQRGSADR